MNYPLQTTYRGIPESAELDRHIREKAERLGSFYDRIKSCHVIVEIPHKHHHQGKQFNIRIDIGVPGDEIVVNHDHSEDVYVALRDAFDAARRQLEDYARKQRGDVKMHENKRAQGVGGLETD
jgi:ribosomal subunit interface protein